MGISKTSLDERISNLNRRMERRGSLYRYSFEGRCGYVGLDRIRASDGAVLSTVTCGTKREIYDALHFMMVALDDAEYAAEPSGIM